MRIHLKVWRQAAPNAPGGLADYTVEHVSPDMSFLEMLDVLNEGLIARDEDPVTPRLPRAARSLVPRIPSRLTCTASRATRSHACWTSSAST